MADKFYNLKNILAQNADYNIIIGERSNGKTFATLKYCLEEYWNSGKTKHFCYLRRWGEDIIGKRASSLFSAIEDKGFIRKLTKNQYTLIKYYNGKFYLGNYDSEGKKIIADKEPFCYIFSLGDMEHDKSTAYPKIHNIIFDEFITRRAYLKDEFIIFLNVLSTIIRERDGVKIFMLGNTVNKYCPYFAELGINIEKLKQGTINTYQYGENENLKVALEYCDNALGKEKSNRYFAFDNPRLNMIKNGQWELDLYPHLPPRYTILPKDIVFHFYIKFDNKVVEGDIVENGKASFIFFHYKTTEIKEKMPLIYQLEISTEPNIRKDILGQSDKLDKRIAKYFVNSKVFYQNNEIGELVHNYLLNCIKH